MLRCSAINTTTNLDLFTENPNEHEFVHLE